MDAAAWTPASCDCNVMPVGTADARRAAPWRLVFETAVVAHRAIDADPGPGLHSGDGLSMSPASPHALSRMKFVHGFLPDEFLGCRTKTGG